MKTYPFQSIIALILILTACTYKDQAKSGYKESQEFAPTPDEDKKEAKRLKATISERNASLIDIDKGLKETFGEYFISFDTGVLSLCCSDKLAYPFGSNESDAIKSYCPSCRDSVYEVEINGQMDERIKIYKESFDLTAFTYAREDGFTEYYLEDSSYFADPNILLNNGLTIGMTKKELFDQYFWTDTDSILPELEMIAVCPDERGELFTQYRFKNDTLHSIIYGYKFYKIQVDK